MNSAPRLTTPCGVIYKGPRKKAPRHRTAHRMTEAASLNGVEHQPSKLRGAGSSPAAVASQKRSAPEGAGHEQVAGPEGGWGPAAGQCTRRAKVPFPRHAALRGGPRPPPPPICSAQSMEQLDG